MKLVSSAPETPSQDRSAERTALVKAIEAAAEGRRAIERNRAQRSSGPSNWSARPKPNRHAPASLLRVLVSMLAPARPPRSHLGALCRAARQAELEAADECDAAKSALSQLQSKQLNLEAANQSAELGIEVEINRLLAGAAPAMIERLEALKGEMLALQSVLWFVRGRRAVAEGTHHRVVDELAAPLAEIEPKITHAIEVDVPFYVAQAERHAALGVWRKVVEELKQNADTPLPDA